MNSYWIYKPSGDKKNRYILGRDGENTLIFFGINPSIAEPCHYDHTITKIERFSEKLGYDGWIMLNIYPQRTTDSNDVHIKIDNAISIENIKTIQEILINYNSDIVFAWGTSIQKRKYFIDILDEIVNLKMFKERKHRCLGDLTIDGHPRHPERLSYNTELKGFDIASYLSKLKDKSNNIL